MSVGNLDNIQEKKISRNFKNSKKFWKSAKNWNSRFQNFEKIDLIILPNRSNRSNRKKSLNRLHRFIGQRINTSLAASWRSTYQILVRGSTYLPILVRGFNPPTKFCQIAFGAGSPSKIGEGRTKKQRQQCLDAIEDTETNQDGTCVWRTAAQWRLPGKKRVSTQEKSDFAIALRFNKRKSRRCTQT